MKKWTYLLLFGLILFVLGIDTTPIAAQDCDAYCVVAAVNAFRTANGLPVLQIESSLMAAAQAHSDYQASIGQVTHTGSGGSRPVDRATAFGFGGGAQIFVSENIAGGMTMTIEKAIYQYWQDSLHLNTMLNPAALYIGAGVGIANGYVYYTVDTGYYVGAPVSSSGDTPETTVGPAPTSGPTSEPFIKSTPRYDGTIIHVVGYGQSLIGIANSYEVEVAEVLILNNLTLDSIIYPGDKIILKPSHTPTVTGAAKTTAPSVALTASATTLLTQSTSQPVVTFSIPNTQTPSITPSPTLLVISPENEPMVVGAVLFALVAFLSVIIGGLFKKRDQSQQDPGA